MEKMAAVVLLAALTLVLIRVLLLPVKLAFRLGLHCGCGLLCLWLLNAVSGITGIVIPVNAATVLIAGILGLPGLTAMAALTLL